MKAAPVIRALADREVAQAIIHTGQHYDTLMSDVFFADLGIQEPDVNLGVGSGSHAVQTAALMTGLETALLDLDPAIVVVYGDVNSTLAAAVTATKLGMAVAHVEAGLRSFDRTMPEEINRVVTDALADVLFATSPEAIGHLANEGVSPDRVHLVGNPMIDTLLGARDALDPERLLGELELHGPFALSTLHRPANVDDGETAQRIVSQLAEVGRSIPVVLPLHPRGREVLRGTGLFEAEGIRVIDPLGYNDFVALMSVATVVLTDSGGVQEETTILDVPCLTVRPNTERPITISHGTNRLVTPEQISAGVASVLDGSYHAPPERPPLWDGLSGRRIAHILAGLV
jgi:UDP-N-acetylglucosamine 2-epimerase (non-hydrolysing)